MHFIDAWFSDKMKQKKSQIARKAAQLGHLRTKAAKEELHKVLGKDFEILSKGYPDITAFNSKTRTFYFIELKSQKEIGKPLRPEQEKIKKILDKITGKKQYEVWYFSDVEGEKDKILVKCIYYGKTPEPYYPKKLSDKLAKKFGISVRT